MPRQCVADDDGRDTTSGPIGTFENSLNLEQRWIGPERGPDAEQCEMRGTRLVSNPNGAVTEGIDDELIKRQGTARVNGASHHGDLHL